MKLFGRDKLECPPELRQQTYIPQEKRSINAIFNDCVSFTAEIPRSAEGKKEYVLIQRSKYLPCGDCSCHALIFNGGIRSVEANCKKPESGYRSCEIFTDSCKVLTEEFENEISSSYKTKNPTVQKN